MALLEEPAQPVIIPPPVPATLHFLIQVEKQPCVPFVEVAAFVRFITVSVSNLHELATSYPVSAAEFAPPIRKAMLRS